MNVKGCKRDVVCVGAACDVPARRRPCYIGAMGGTAFSFGETL
jgi:hypothetical protein